MSISKSISNNSYPKCNLGRMQAKVIDTEKIKYEAFNNDGILVVKVDDERLSWPEKEIIKEIGKRIYRSSNLAESVKKNSLAAKNKQHQN